MTITTVSEKEEVRMEIKEIVNPEPKAPLPRKRPNIKVKVALEPKPEPEPEVPMPRKRPNIKIKVALEPRTEPNSSVEADSIEKSKDNVTADSDQTKVTIRK